MFSNRKISIVIVTYNSEKYISKNLSSIIKHNSNTINQIIVADSNSKDNTLKIVKEHFPDVEILRLNNNGYGSALNSGFKICKNDYIIAANDDIYFIDNSINKVFNIFEKNKDIGVIGPKLLNEDLSLQKSITNNPSLIKDFFQIIFPNIVNAENIFFKNFISIFQNFSTIGRFDSHKQSKIVPSVKGAFLIFRKSVFDVTGGFDERIKFIGEEQIFSLKAKRKGWKTYYENDVTVIHVGGQSLGIETSERNKKRYAIKIQSNLIYFKLYKSQLYYYLSTFIYSLALFMRYSFLILTRSESRYTISFLLNLILKNNILSYDIYKEN
jgi:GT2 family glycosyltransferase